MTNAWTSKLLEQTHDKLDDLPNSTPRSLVSPLLEWADDELATAHKRIAELEAALEALDVMDPLFGTTVELDKDGNVWGWGDCNYCQWETLISM